MEYAINGGAMCRVGVWSMAVARGVWGHTPLGKFKKMNFMRHILAHSQPNIMMGRLFTRTP